MNLIDTVKTFWSRTALWAALILLLFWATACGGAAMEPSYSRVESGDSNASDDGLYYDDEPALAPPAEPDAYGGSSGEGQDNIALQTLQTNAPVQAQETRIIIYTGDIALIVKDTQEAIKAITALAQAQDGFVAGSNVYQAGEVLRGSITIRVPAGNYQDVLSQLRDMALRVERENSATQDITEEFVDLQARKTNLELTEQALQELLNERKRMGSTSDILDVHRELTLIRGQIEQIEGRLRYLSNQAALSTITVTLTPDVLYQPVSVGGWEPQGVAKQALQALVTALQGLGNILIWLLIFALPLLIVIFMPVILLALIIRGLWKRRNKKNEAS